MRDVIVIGAGGGGPVMAKELAGRGLDVLMLEAGGRHAEPEKEWAHLENDANNPATGYFRWGPSDRTKPAWLRELPQLSYIFQVSGVGGTTLHYYGNHPRAMPGVFRGFGGRNAGAYDRAHQFPFAYRELVPYFEWVEHTLPVETAAMGTKEEVFLDAARRRGLAYQSSKDATRDAHRPQENAILQPRGTAGRSRDPKKIRYPDARGCTFCGFCLQGCYEPRGAPRNHAAKRSTDNSYAPMALTADAWARGGKAVTLVTDAFVTRVETEQVEGAPRARAVHWRDTRTGAQSSEEAKVVVLAAGCVENPRLWFNSGLPNPNGWVGRGLTDHAFDMVLGVMPYYTGSSKGPSSAARCDYPARGGLENFAFNPGYQAAGALISDAGMAGLYDNGAEIGTAGAKSLGRLVGSELKSLMSDIDRLISILVITDDDVEPQNRVELSTGLPPDEHGQVPKATIRQSRRSARTRRNREDMAGEAVKILKAGGAKDIYRIGWPSVILHVQSTMRMGESESDSVLDENAESRAVKGLFIADNSALANSLGGPNPTLTTQALATRTAEKIFERYFDGSPWVTREAPVISTSPAVTKAVIKRGL